MSRSARPVAIVLASILVGVGAAVGFDAARSAGSTEGRAGGVDPSAEPAVTDPTLQPLRDVVLPLPEPIPGTRRAGASRTPDLSGPRAVAAPASVTLPSPDEATVKVVPVGTGGDGQLHPPSDGRLAGWWTGGPRPGEPGRALLVGHVDTKEGLGAFAALHGLTKGDRLAVTAADGQQIEFTVSSVREVTKQALGAADLTGGPGSELLLVTCTGEFDRAVGHYESNLLVLATPV